MQGFFTGINYWALKNATRMWEEFDEKDIARDMDDMVGCGITHLRVFPMWHVFQPLKALYTTRKEPFEYRFGEERLPDTPAGRAGVSEEACRKFEVFCDLAEQHGLKLIVGLITGHMSFREFAPEAFAGRHRLSDPTVLKWQLRYVKYFVERFRDRECIAGWDLGNEVNNMAHTEGMESDDFYVWCSAISDAIRSRDRKHPVVSGMDTSVISRGADNLETIRDTCDIHTCHPYNIFYTQQDPLPTMKSVYDAAFKCRMDEDLTGVPTFVQEFGSIGYMNCSEKTEAMFYRGVLLTCLARGCHGIMWWCAFDQGHLRFAPYDWNNIGSNYGFFDKDRRAKPIAAVNLKLQPLISQLQDITRPREDSVILVPRDNGDADIDKLRSAWLLAVRSGLCPGFSDALEKIPDSPLYILPSLESNQSITGTRLDELMEKVRGGSTLYISLGNALFRDIPSLTGVTVAYRECVAGSHTVELNGKKLPVASPVRYTIESADCEILARDEEGTPVLFRKKTGNGYVYLSLYPIEKAAAGYPGAMWKDDAPEYEEVYRLIGENTGCAGKARGDRFVHVTEHAKADGTRVIIAVNVSEKARKVKLTGCEGITRCLYGSMPDEDGCVTLDACDGAVYVTQ